MKVLRSPVRGDEVSLFNRGRQGLPLNTVKSTRASRAAEIIMIVQDDGRFFINGMEMTVESKLSSVLGKLSSGM